METNYYDRTESKTGYWKDSPKVPPENSRSVQGLSNFKHSVLQQQPLILIEKFEFQLYGLNDPTAGLYKLISVNSSMYDDRTPAWEEKEKKEEEEKEKEEDEKICK